MTAYDSSGNEFSKTAYTGYDALGRVRGSSQTTDTQSYTMSYEYDRSGNLTSQTYPSGKVVETVYDGAGRIAGVRRVESGGSLSYYAGADGGTNAIGYAPHGGMREVLLGNGLWEQRRYNSRLQPTQIGLGTGKTAVGTGLGTTDSGLLLLDYAYGTSANNGNVASQRIRAGTLNLTQSYTYDDLNRLKTASESGGGTAWSQAYELRPLRQPCGDGDRRSYLPSQALTPQSLNVFDTATNRLDGMNGMNTVTVAYDGAGNLTRDWGGRSFTYDGENRMVSFDTTGTDQDTTYYYDGEGRRVKKAVGGTGRAGNDLCLQRGRPTGGRIRHPLEAPVRHPVSDPGPPGQHPGGDRPGRRRRLPPRLPALRGGGRACLRGAQLGLRLHGRPHQRSRPEVYREGTGQRVRTRLLQCPIL